MEEHEQDHRGVWGIGGQCSLAWKYRGLLEHRPKVLVSTSGWPLNARLPWGGVGAGKGSKPQSAGVRQVLAAAPRGMRDWR